jgi:signal transduction histidine kinase
MHILKYWSLAITTGSFKVRLAIWLGTFPICLGLYALFFSTTHNGTIAVLPILTGAWLFKYRGMLISIISTSTIIYLLNCILFAPSFVGHSNLFGTLIGSIFGIIFGLVGCMLRQAFDTVVSSRQQVMLAEYEKMLAYESNRQAQEARRRIALAYEQQQELNQQKNLFLAHVNHELCTPLVTVSGYLELLLTYHERLDEAKQLSYLRKALESAQELNELVTNLLDAAQFTASEVAPVYEKIPLAQVTQEVLAQWNPHDLQDFTFSMEIHDSVLAWADRRFLFHILRNLLSNACKYAPRQTTVRIQAAYNSSGESQEVCLSVKDEGKGIPPDQIALLFEKFVRLPQDMTGPVRGTGLGLYICKQFVEAMGGHIWVESSGVAGEGSCFCVSLPATQSASALPTR